MAFVHGKAGVIGLADGRKLGFIGSMNETRSGWQRHYEILWEDESPEGVAWIEDEFEFLWNAARPLPAGGHSQKYAGVATAGRCYSTRSAMTRIWRLRR